MIYCPECSDRQGGPVAFEEMTRAMTTSVLEGGNLIRLSAICRICNTVIHIQQESHRNNDGSYTILKVSQ